MTKTTQKLIKRIHMTNIEGVGFTIDEDVYTIKGECWNDIDVSPISL